jgi:hypothetical protein
MSREFRQSGGEYMCLYFLWALCVMKEEKAVAASHLEDPAGRLCRVAYPATWREIELISIKSRKKNGPCHTGSRVGLQQPPS